MAIDEPAYPVRGDTADVAPVLRHELGILSRILDPGQASLTILSDPNGNANRLGLLELSRIFGNLIDVNRNHRGLWRIGRFYGHQKLFGCWDMRTSRLTPQR